MSKLRKACEIAAALVGVTLGVSLFTSYSVGSGSVGPGAWGFTVTDAAGEPLPGAELRVLRADGTHPRHLGNYTGPGTVTADAAGSLTFRMYGIACFGSHGVDVFWIWPVYRSDSPLLEITAPGYESQRFRLVGDPVDRVVRLEKRP